MLAVGLDVDKVVDDVGRGCDEREAHRRGDGRRDPRQREEMRRENGDEDEAVLRPLMDAEKLEPVVQSAARSRQKAGGGVKALQFRGDARRRADRDATCGDVPNREVRARVPDIVEALGTEAFNE
jgi:hypothetical protein